MGRQDRQEKKDAAEREKRTFRWQISPAVPIGIIVVVLVAVLGSYFSYLDEQLFEARKIHIEEFTGKASEIVDSVIEYSWQQVAACEHMIKTDPIRTEEELLSVLASASDFIDFETSVILAIDEYAGCYSSEYDTGRWMLPELLTDSAGRRQQIVSEIPHKAGENYFIFISRLEDPVVIGSQGGAITHLALAVNIDAMQENISVQGYGNRCYTYLVNEDGRRLYKNTYTNHFIEGYNIRNSFQEYRIVHGCTHEEFIGHLERGEHTALEFEFVEPDGEKQNWFVASAPLSSENWSILLFVPTDVLGTGTIQLMNRTLGFFMVVALLFVLLIAVVIITAMISKADKQLMRQKDEANRLLQISAEEAKSANRAKSDFLSHMSHDIRTPINGIMGMTEIAIKNIDTKERVLDCLRKISGSSQHLLGLINDVLDMSRIESGKTKVNHEPFDLRVCIDNCISIIGGQLTTRSVELVREAEEFAHPHLIGDELHLRQVFINILGNSVKFTPDGGRIFFRAVEKESTDDKAFFRFELEDTGIGMKPEFVPHLFEAFSQEDGGTRTTYKGTGLGMAITKQFLDLMGATIEVESEPGRGTKFVIEVWIDRNLDTKADRAVTEHHVDLRGMKVLLVEDIELNLEIAQSILEDEGVVITTAMNGQEAVDAFAGNPPGTFDVILMDIMMPVMDGITATKTIRAMEREDAGKIPILAMTANAYEEDIQNTRKAGMDAHLSKPIDIGLLLKTLSEFGQEDGRERRKADLTGLCALLADDVELNLEIAKEMLEEMGVIVTAVSSGKEAVDAFSGSKEGAFDVILMDVHMPVMDGIAATKAIRAMDRTDAKSIPILALTADVYEEDIRATGEAGMTGHLTKPLHADVIRSTIAGCCGQTGPRNK